MPIFEYVCQGCGHHHDALQKAGEAALRKCPECGELKLAKALSTPSFHLHGSGWRKPAPSQRKRTVVRKGHTLDSGPAHSHEDPAPARGQGGGQSQGHGHAHSHGGHSHSHGPGEHKHGHKH